MTNLQASQTPAKNFVTLSDPTLHVGDRVPGATLATDEKGRMAAQQEKVYGDVHVVQAGHPSRSGLDFDMVMMAVRHLQTPVVSALARPKEVEVVCAVAALENCARPRVHVLGDLGLGSEGLRLLERSVLSASQRLAGRGDVECELADAVNMPANELVHTVLKLADAGATVFTLPDNAGQARPDAYGQMFRTLAEATQGQPRLVFGAHTHDAFGNAAANNMAALAGGARQVVGSVNGVGENGGHMPMQTLVARLTMAGVDNPFTRLVDQPELEKAGALYASFVSHSSSLLGGSGLAVANGDFIARRTDTDAVEALLAKHKVDMSAAHLGGFMKQLHNVLDCLLETVGQRFMEASEVADMAVDYLDKQCAFHTDMTGAPMFRGGSNMALGALTAG